MSTRKQRMQHPAVKELRVERHEDPQLRVADWITAFAGSMPFVYIHAVIFAVWWRTRRRPVPVPTVDVDRVARGHLSLDVRDDRSEPTIRTRREEGVARLHEPRTQTQREHGSHAPDAHEYAAAPVAGAQSWHQRHGDR